MRVEGPMVILSSMSGFPSFVFSLTVKLDSSQSNPVPFFLVGLETSSPPPAGSQRFEGRAGPAYNESI